MAMTKDDIAKFRELYLQTAGAYLRDLESNLMMFALDHQNITAVKNIHLASHSLAGQSTMMGYVDMSTYAGLIEKVFRANKESGTEIADDVLSLITEAVKIMQESLKRIEATGEEIKMPTEIEKLKMSGGVQ